MKIDNKFLLLLIPLLFLFKKKSNANNQNSNVKNENVSSDIPIKSGILNSKPFTQNDFNIAFLRLQPQYRWSKEKWQLAEKCWRMETAHFKSQQFLNSFSCGQVAVSKNYPYGWYSLRPLWTTKPNSKPIYLYKIFVKRANKNYYYVAYDRFSYGLENFMYMIDKVRGGNVLAWGYLNKDAQQNYLAKIKNIRTPFIDKIFA